MANSSVPKKTSGPRNREAGHIAERELVKEFRKAGFEHVRTSRACAPLRDAQKIDLANEDEAENGRFSFNVQVKNYASPIPYAKLLKSLPVAPGIFNVVMHKQTTRAGNRFLPVGHYSFLHSTDFLHLVKVEQLGREAIKRLLQKDEGTVTSKDLLEVLNLFERENSTD